MTGLLLVISWAVWATKTLSEEWSTRGQGVKLRYDIIGGLAQKESIIGGIITLPRPAPIIHPFPAWKPPS